jgi:hypothetical protein
MRQAGLILRDPHASAVDPNVKGLLRGGRETGSKVK